MVAPEIKTAYDKLLAHPPIQQGLAFLAADEENTIADQKTITEIPAPPFQEKQRAAYYCQRLAALGLDSVTTDSEGNVFGVYKGMAAAGPKIFVCAHLDTVFPAGTPIAVKEKDGRLYAPGIADDARGLTVVLAVIRALKESGLKTAGDIIFGGTVGEEGLGDLRGVKHFFREHPDIDGFITVDGTGTHMITYLAAGSRRYEIVFQGPGGHSFGAFGLPSATHALGRAIAKIADIRPPAAPKTTFTVGTVSGGTSVNAIAARAAMLVDMRSGSNEELKCLEEKVLAFVQEACQEENARWDSKEVTVKLNLVGDRPAGQQATDSAIIQAAWAATEAVGVKPELSPASSTDANLPLSLGIPALRLGGGGKDGRNHSLDEWFDPAAACLGPQKVFLTILGLVGVADLTPPVLPLRK